MMAQKRTKESLHTEIAELKQRLQGMEEGARNQKQASADVWKENEARLANIVESAMDAIISVDSQQNILVFNKAAEEMFHYSAPEAIGRPISLFIPKRFRALHQEHIQRYGQTGGTSRRMGSLGTISGLRSNGEEFPLEAAISQSLVKGEKIFTVILRDITERKKNEEIRTRMAAILEQMADLVVVTDLMGKIEYVNQACAPISGYLDSELIGSASRIFKSDRHNQNFFENMWQTILRGDTWSGQITNRKKDGSLCQESMVVFPVRDKDGKIINYASIRRDISKQLTLEEQFHQAQKMDAIGRLAGGVAHDFNNLLTVINGYCELMLFDSPPEAPTHQGLKEIHQAAAKASHLTRQLLTFCRRQRVETEFLEVNQVVTNIDQMLKRLIGEDIELITILDPSLDPVEMNPGSLEQVIVNLAVNARDAMPDGGKLILETTNAELDESYTSLHSGMTPGSYVMLAVTDTGHGMSPEVQSKIFEPFFTTKGVGKGTGLGLSTVYGIVQNLQGNIWVYSELDKGTIFKIYFPTAKSHRLPAQLAEEDPLPKGNKNVLLVEDDESVRRLGKKILENAGYWVYEAKDGLEALKMAEDLRDRIDLLVTDVVMPHMSGRQLAEKLKAVLPQLKVLFVSGYTDQAFAHFGDLTQGDGFLQKPFTAAGIIRRISEILQQ